MAEETVSLSVGAEITLKVSDVWPNGDAPAVLTAAAVKEAMESYGSKSRVLHDWNLLDQLEVCAYVPNPHHTQEEALLPEHAAPPLLEARVWG